MEWFEKRGKKKHKASIKSNCVWGIIVSAYENDDKYEK